MPKDFIQILDWIKILYHVLADCSLLVDCPGILAIPYEGFLFTENGIPVGSPLAFDYRPYVINWCLNLKVLDGYKVTPMER